MRKGERAGPSRSVPRKAGKGLEPGIKSVRQEAKKSPVRRRDIRDTGHGRGSEKSGESASWNGRWTTQWQSWDEPSWQLSGYTPGREAVSADHWDRWDQDRSWRTTESSRVCEYFESGHCHWGSSCYFSHDWHETQLQVEDAGIVFLLDADAADVLVGPNGSQSADITGPMRVRIVGDVEDLGFSEGQWDPNLGIDLCWEGDGWRSMVIPMAPQHIFHFCVVRVDQPETTSGMATLQGWRRWEVHEARQFTWSRKHQLRAPGRNEILEVHLQGQHCGSAGSAPSAGPRTRVVPRGWVTTAPGRPLWQPAGMRCFTFDAYGQALKYCLYLPDTNRTEEPLTLVLFLHSMHGKLEGDNNLFFESDTPLRLLLDEDEDRCPGALRERCILLAPQCPTDRDRGDGAGIWLRKGWYEESDYDLQAEAALMALVEMIQAQYALSHVSLCGSSMGAYGALELASRRPNFFSKVALIAAHYDLDPIEPLVTRLTEKQEVPLWFIHAENDNVCPFADMAELVRRLRARSRAEVYLTSFEDTWSSQGHCADCVAFWARPVVPGAPALGHDLFEWLTA